MLAAALLAGLAVVPSSTPAGAGEAHDKARQIDNQPSTFYWAVIVGISDYAGRTQDLSGSARDAQALRDHLKSLGWLDDHIYLLTDRSATKANILKGIRWLASKTNNRSAAVFHFSGHEQPFRTSSDGDNEKRDVALRAYDNQFILDGDLGKEMGKVKAARVWVNLSVCRAGGFSDKGMVGNGRVLTYSSPESQLSYDDPNVRHSVFGYYSILKAMKERQADRNRDGKITVEEAFWWARQPVIDRTGGRQHPAITDKLSGDFSITPPPPPATNPPPGTNPPAPTPAPTPPCTLPVCVTVPR